MMRPSLLVLSLLLMQCSKPFPEAGPVSLLSLATAIEHYVFVTATAYSGNLLAAGSGATGVKGADQLCATAKDAEQPNLPGTGSEYRALLIDSASRVACISANCTTSGASEHVDWVLQPNTTYKRPDGASVFTTNSAGIFLMASGLQAPIAASGQWWTGLDTVWGDSGSTCTNWGTTAGSGFFGIGGTSASTAMADGALGTTCASTLSLLCVR